MKQSNSSLQYDARAVRQEEDSSSNHDPYELLFASNPIPMWVFDRRSLRFLDVNEAAVVQYGYSRRDFLEMTVDKIRSEARVPLMMQDYVRINSSLQNHGVRQHRRKSGELIDVEIVCHGLEFNGVDSVLVAAHDVTQRRREHEALRSAEEKYRAIFDNAVAGIFQVDPTGRPISLNHSLAKMHGFESPEQFLAEVKNVAAELFVEPDRMRALLQAADQEGLHSAEVEVYRKDGSRFWILASFHLVRKEDGQVDYCEGFVLDITDRKAAESEVERLAYFDPLTDLPNRTFLRTRLKAVLLAAARQGEKVALLCLDLDRFKLVNDSIGHTGGDRMLREISARLTASVRSTDIVARTGGDEFMIVLRGVESAATVLSRAREIKDVVSRPFEFEGRSLSTCCSVGIGLFPDHGERAEDLMRNADTAMYRARELGSCATILFSDEMNGESTHQAALENDLRLALRRDEFFLVYQPQIEIATGKIVGMEALIRWHHPERGFVPPDQFIRLAEVNGAILPIGEWVLRTACTQAREWHMAGLPAVPVAVNVSAVQFRQEGFCEFVESVLHQTGLAPELLELELTEGILLSNGNAIRKALERLSALGVKLAIDDFGTGYSSLSYLKQFRFNRLKIDRSFIRELPGNGDDAAITAAMISMAKHLKIKVVAEGVETEPQLSFLQSHECDDVQGYYFSKPLAASQMAERLRSRGTAQSQPHRESKLLFVPK